MIPHLSRRALAAALTALVLAAGPLSAGGIGAAGAATGTPVTTTTTLPSDGQTGSGQSKDGQYGSLKDDYDKILADQAVLLKKLADTVQKRQAVQLELFALDLQIQDSTKQLVTAEASYRDASNSYNQAQKDLAIATRKMEAARQEMQAQAISSYVRGGNNNDLLQSILDVAQRGTAGQTATYTNAMVTHQQEVIKEFKAARKLRDKRAKAADATKNQAQVQRDAVTRLRDGLQATRSGRAAVEKNLAAEQWVEQLAFSELDKKKLGIVLKSVGLRRDADGISDMINIAQKGQPDFVFPLVPLQDPVPHNTTLTQSFGPQGQPVLGVQGFHPGIDLAGPAGEPIAAAADGIVLVAGPLGGYGNAVVIDHGNHLATLYGHQEQVIAKVGDHVKAGDIIGLRGSTGFSTGPHVHFETRVYGVPVDPLLFIHLP